MPSPIKVRQNSVVALLTNAATYELAIIVLAALQGSTSTFDVEQAGAIGEFYRQHKFGVGATLLVMSGGSVIGLLFAKIVGARKEDPLRWINPLLQSLQKGLSTVANAEPGVKVRVYVVAPDQKHEWWYPITRYIGDSVQDQPEPSPRLRDIAGLAIDVPMAVLAANMGKNDVAEDFYVTNLGFERHKLGSADLSFVSKAGFCVGKPNGTHVVLCCEASRKGFFSKQNKGRMAIITATGMTLAEHFGCK